jgi:hypothetical protein
MPRNNRVAIRLLRIVGVSTSMAASGICLALWICSFFTGGVLIWDLRGFTFVAHSERNLIGLRFYQDDQGPDTGFSIRSYSNPDYKQTSGLWDELKLGGVHGWPAIGLAHYRNLTDRNYGWAVGNRPIDSIYAPHWLLVLLFAIPSTVWFALVTRSRARSRRGYCVQCGYDLRATPERCPECGWLADAAANPAGA